MYTETSYQTDESSQIEVPSRQSVILIDINTWVDNYHYQGQTIFFQHHTTNTNQAEIAIIIS